MAKKKFYAVQQGRQPGVYTTWADCEAQVVGYGGAIYKSFPTLAEAEAFVKGGGYGGAKVAPSSSAKSNPAVAKVQGPRGLTGKAGSARQDACELFAYIDGSFDSTAKAVGYGGVIGHGDTVKTFSLGTKDPAYAQYWNIAGELLAAGYVIRYAQQQGVQSVALYYDCEGIEKWARGLWKTNNSLTERYATFMKAALETIHIEFYKVAAHTGVEYNEWADRLAKEGVTRA